MYIGDALPVSLMGQEIRVPGGGVRDPVRYSFDTHLSFSIASTSICENISYSSGRLEC